MPTAPSPKRAEAKSMYLASGGKEKLRTIAEKIGVSEGTLRGWKAKDHWANELSGALRKKERSAPKKRGAPKGNKNAVGNKGGGAPTGEANGNYEHGGYSKIYWDTLDADERVLFDAEPMDEEDMLVEQIMLLSIRERRLLLAIKKYRDSPGGQTIQSIMRIEDKTEFRDDEELEKARYLELREKKQAESLISYFGHNASITTTTQSTIEVIKSLEATLTQVQGRKLMCIKALAALRMSREKLGLEKLKMGVGDDDQLRIAKELLGGIESAF